MYVCSEVSKFPTNSDTGVLHLPITKGVWTPVSPLPPTFFSPSGHPVCPCPGREAPRSLSAVPWGKVKAVISMTGRRRRAKEECYKSEPHSHLSQLRETQSNLSFKGEDEEEERLTPQWWIQKHKCIFFFVVVVNLWALLKSEPLDDSLEQRKPSPQSDKQSSCLSCVFHTSASRLWFVQYNQCCTACKQTVQGLNFWSDRAAAEKVQARSDHTASSRSGEGCWPRK